MSQPASPLVPALAVTFAASLATSVFWNAIAFVSKAAFSFSAAENFALYVLMGVVYTIGAWRSGIWMDALERHCRPRTVLAGLVVGTSAASALPALVPTALSLWIAAALVSLLSSILWPIVHAFVTAGRHGPEMRRAIGLFNLVWMTAVALPLLAMGPVLESHPLAVFASLAALNLLALPMVVRLAPAPPAHAEAEHAAHVPPSYIGLLRAARTLLPLSYVLNATVSPLLPYRFDEIGTPMHSAPALAACWMVTRVIVVTAMWRTQGWHGRSGTLVVAAATMAGGFGTIALGPSTPWIMVGLAAFGVGLGIVYYAALYYGMAVGRAEVDAGGAHEALIGAGYTIGPIAALAGQQLGEAVPGIGPGHGIVACVGAILVTGLAVAATRLRSARG